MAFRKPFTIKVLLTVVFAAFLTGVPFINAAGEPEAFGPDPRYSPEQVVKIQLEALQKNDIETTFRFASPANKAQTGPLERFTMMINSPLYSPMIGSVAIEYLTMDVESGRVRQRVLLTAETGDRIVYVFYLSKQEENPFRECWMTDAVFIESWEEGGAVI
jgi:hypothetical protein